MKSKLTLTVNKELAREAKVYARNHGRSLSDLVESYFKILRSKETYNQDDLTEKVKSLMASIKVSEDFDYKAELSDKSRNRL